MKHSYLLAIMFTVLFINVQAQNIEFDVGAYLPFYIEDDFDPTLFSGNGYGQIGNSSSNLWAMYANSMYSYNYNSLSDERAKENIRDLGGVSDRLKNVRVVNYDIKREKMGENVTGKRAEEIEAIRKNKVGFLAQNLKEQFPDVVQYDNDNDVYYVNYDAMVPILLKAIKEQQAEIEALKSQVANSK